MGQLGHMGQLGPHGTARTTRNMGQLGTHALGGSVHFDLVALRVLVAQVHVVHVASQFVVALQVHVAL